jgi:hypothetical protein
MACTNDFRSMYPTLVEKVFPWVYSSCTCEDYRLSQEVWFYLTSVWRWRAAWLSWIVTNFYYWQGQPTTYLTLEVYTSTTCLDAYPHTVNKQDICTQRPGGTRNSTGRNNWPKRFNSPGTYFYSMAGFFNRHNLYGYRKSSFRFCDLLFFGSFTFTIGISD